MNVDCHAGLRGTRCKRHAQLGVAAAARPVGGSILNTNIGVRAIDIGRERVGVVRLNRDGLIALAGRRTARRHL